MKPAPPPSACLRRQAERDAAPRTISISHSAAWPIIAHRKSLPGGFTTSARRFIIPSDSIVSGMGLVSSNSIYRRTSKTARFCAADGAFANGVPRFRADDIAGPSLSGSRSQTVDASGRPAQWNLERRAYIGLRKECKRGKSRGGSCVRLTRLGVGSFRRGSLSDSLRPCRRVRTLIRYRMPI